MTLPDPTPPKDPALTRRAMLRGQFLKSLLGGDEGLTPEGSSTAGVDEGRTTKPSSPGAAPTPPSARRRSFPVLRPPGAVCEEEFLDACTRCGACIEVCPHDAIRLAPERFRDAAGTPMIDPHQAPCRVCEDLPCVTACQDPRAGRVLRFDLPIRMGTAEIQPWNCLAHQQALGIAACSACVDHCPVDGAIEVIGNRPRVVASTCVGCGVCHHVCPAPQNAVIVLPAATRPAAPLPASSGPIAGSEPALPVSAPASPDVEHLPDLYQATLDRLGLEALLDDLGGHASIESIRARAGRRGQSGAVPTPGLAEIADALLRGAVSAVRITYRFDGRRWIDTLSAGEDGSIRLVRITAPAELAQDGA